MGKTDFFPRKYSNIHCSGVTNQSQKLFLFCLFDSLLKTVNSKTDKGRSP